MNLNSIREGLLLLIIYTHIVYEYFQFIQSFENYIKEENYKNLMSTKAFLVRKTPGVWIKKIIFKVLCVLLELLIVVGIWVSGDREMKSSSDIDMSTRIENISQNLAETSVELSSIQQELEERIEFVEGLKKEAEIAENVISLTDEQVNAVQEKINQELKESSNESFIQNILISTIFFVLGILVQPITKLFKNKLNKENQRKVEITENKYSPEKMEKAIKILEIMEKEEK